jgi:aminoglycoside phosphotransferase (APT) family kinase protein
MAMGIAFGADGWRCYVPELRMEFQMAPPGKTLADVPLLTDPQAARALLEQSLRTTGPGYQDLHLEGCTPEVLRAKGNRSTIRYHLEYPADLAGLAASHGWPEQAIAKTYRGKKGQIAYEGMRALWASPLARGDVVHIAEPLAYLPEPPVLLQGLVRGERTLKDLLKSAVTSGTPHDVATLADYMCKTAVGLAALHGSAVQADATVTWENRLAEIREEVAHLAPAVPEFAAAVMALLARLEAQAAACPADPPVPAHGGFRPAQVLLYDGQVGFIDFDDFCQAEPAMDLAQFCATVKSAGLSGALADEDADEDGTALPDRQACQARLAELEAFCEVFLAHYEAHHSVSRQRVWLWEALDTLTKLLHSLQKVQPGRLSLRMLLLERHLQALGPAVSPTAQASHPDHA